MRRQTVLGLVLTLALAPAVSAQPTAYQPSVYQPSVYQPAAYQPSAYRPLYAPNQQVYVPSYRYQVLRSQYGAFGALADPALQDQLRMTEGQRFATQLNLEWSQEQTRVIGAQMASGPGLGRQQLRDYQRQYEYRLSRLLTPDQQRAWRELSSEPSLSIPPR